MTDELKSSRSNVIKFTRESDKLTDDFSDRRGEKILNKLVIQNPEFEPQLRRAHDLLNGDPNYASAMHKSALALTAGQINVFISYHVSADAAAAKELAKIFRELSADKVRVTFADEFTKKISGLNYKEQIEEAIKGTHWFIFLISDPKDPSGWCMFETGMFRASMTSKRMNRLLCIYHPEAKLPDPIVEYHAVKAEQDELKRLLDGLFRQQGPLPGWESLNPQISDEDMRAAADRIVKAFKAPKKPVELNHWVKLEVKEPQSLKGWEDLSKCTIETDNMTAKLFGKIEPPRTWGELIDNVVSTNNTAKWLEELCAGVSKTSRNDFFRPISGTFECCQGGIVMRPILHSMEHDGFSGEFHFHIYFVEEICSAPTHKIPTETLALLTAVRMNNRIRWEVLQRFSNVSWNDEEIDACARAFSRIEREVQSFGQWDVELLCSNYGGSAKEKIRQIVDRWCELRGGDPQSGHQEIGELDTALQERDVDRLRNLISECARLNSDFFKISLPVLENLTVS